MIDSVFLIFYKFSMWRSRRTKRLLSDPVEIAIVFTLVQHIGRTMLASQHKPVTKSRSKRKNSVDGPAASLNSVAKSKEVEEERSTFAYWSGRHPVLQAVQSQFHRCRLILVRRRRRQAAASRAQVLDVR